MRLHCVFTGVQEVSQEVSLPTLLPPFVLMILFPLESNNSVTVLLVLFISFSIRPKVLFVTLRSAILAPLKFTMLTRLLDCFLNFTLVICSFCPLLFSLFNLRTKLTFAI